MGSFLQVSSALQQPSLLVEETYERKVLLECAYFCPECTYELTSVKERQSCKLGYIDFKYVVRFDDVHLIFGLHY